MQDVKKQPVFFHGYRTHNFTEKNAVVNYDDVYINLGNALDIESGKVTAPASGVYQFTFAGPNLLDNSYMDVDFCKNNDYIGSSETAVPGDYSSPSTITFILPLNKGDTFYYLFLLLYIGALRSELSYAKIHFSGQLLQETMFTP